MPPTDPSPSPNATNRKEGTLPVIGIRRGQPRDPLEFERNEPERFKAASDELLKLAAKEYDNRRYSFFQHP